MDNVELMQDGDYAKLLVDLEREYLCGARSVGILGVTGVTMRIIRSIADLGLFHSMTAYTTDKHAISLGLPVRVRLLMELALERHDVLLVAADAEKEDILRAALPHIQGAPKVIVAGYGHLTFRDTAFDEIVNQLLVPSSANGYPNTLIHLYQCLVNAARLRLNGVVAEFGMFKGGTTMFLSRVVERLGTNWPVIGFDSFAGFPARRSPLDMYDPLCANERETVGC